MTVGTMIVDEQAFPIDHVALKDGKVVFYTEPMYAPVRIAHDSEVHIHGADGSLILTSKWKLPMIERMKLSTLWGGQSATIGFPVAITSVVGWPHLGGSG